MYYLEQFQDLNNPNELRLELRESSDEGDFIVSSVLIHIPTYTLEQNGNFIDLISDDGRIVSSVELLISEGSAGSPHQLFTMEAD